MGTRRRRIAGLKQLTLAALVLSISSGVQSAPPDVYVGTWRISQLIPGMCQALHRIDKDLSVNLLIVKATGAGYFSLENDGWQFQQRETLSGAISWDGWMNSEPKEFTGSEFKGRVVLLTPVDATFPKTLFDDKQLWIKIPAVGLDRDFQVSIAEKVAAKFADCLKTP